jgi:hypothetical protein
MVLCIIRQINGYRHFVVRRDMWGTRLSAKYVNSMGWLICIKLPICKLGNIGPQNLELVGDNT